MMRRRLHGQLTGYHCCPQFRDGFLGCKVRGAEGWRAVEREEMKRRPARLAPWEQLTTYQLYPLLDESRCALVGPNLPAGYTAD
jgi:hypothetical protein